LGRSESRFVTVCTSSDRTDGIIIVWTVRIEILPGKRGYKLGFGARFALKMGPG
jgi:hypothetical protein